ncbi:MAG: hypothetical protein H8E38_09820 [SAR324 cluster bacterium]|nr:hypothetical protein [SAR324 cluster bacterium]
MISFSSSVLSVEQTVVYFALQAGTQETGTPAPGVGQTDSYLSTLETKHGALKENRQVKPKVLSFDFYKTSGSVASGFGLEIHKYEKEYNFENDNSKVNISAVGLLYGLNFYYRGDFWFPFLGFGTGNYSAKVKEKLVTASSTTYGTVFGQVDKPFYYKFGVRIPINGLGIIFTQQYISANFNVATENKPLSLGGTASYVGLYYGF